MVQNWRLLAALLALPLLSLSAGEATKQPQLQEISLEKIAYNAPVEKKVTSRTTVEKSVTRDDAMRPQGVITPQAAPHLVDGLGVIVSADFIFWKTNVDGTEFAATGFAPFPVEAEGKTQGRVYAPNFKYQPGVKVGLGWHTDHDGWDLTSSWTYLADRTKKRTLTTNATTGQLVSVQPFTQTDLTSSDVESSVAYYLNLDSASSARKQNFNVIDLELGRDFFLSKYLTVRPHLGLKSAWIHQKTTNTYLTAEDQALYTSTNSQHLWSLGVRGGLDTGWHICKNWKVYGDVAFANMYGRVKNRALGSYFNTLKSADVVLSNTLQKYETVIPVIETGLGVSYVQSFYKNQYHVEARLGWEQQVWMGYNRSPDYVTSGNLSTQGLTVKTQVNF